MSTHPAQFADPWAEVRLGDGLGVPVAIGGELTPGALLGAHRRAVFCQPRCDEHEIAGGQAVYAPDVRAGDITVLPGPGNPYATLWWSPAVRYVIPVSSLHVSRSMRRAIRRHDWSTSLDGDFDGVISGCRGDRKPRWITDELVAALRELRDAGWVHTIEVWSGGQLIGGLFGCAVGSVFVMESAFHRAPDAAKVAIADLARRAYGSGITVLDTEVKSDYTVQLGASPLPRVGYAALLDTGAGPGALEPGRRPARYLLGGSEAAAAAAGRPSAVARSASAPAGQDADNVAGQRALG